MFKLKKMMYNNNDKLAFNSQRNIVCTATKLNILFNYLFYLLFKPNVMSSFSAGREFYIYLSLVYYIF